MLELFDQSLNFLVVKVVKKDIPIGNLELLLLNNYSLLRKQRCTVHRPSVHRERRLSRLMNVTADLHPGGRLFSGTCAFANGRQLAAIGAQSQKTPKIGLEYAASH